jgi:inorganic pyrophosphatase
MSFNAWHDVSFGDEAPQVVKGIIEIPKNSRAKYELDKESGLICLDRVIASPMSYPANYGFIPQTYCDDNDPLDILVLTDVEMVPLCLVEAKIIGVMQMIDGGEMDDKIIAVAKGDKNWNHINDISELNPHILAEIRVFFEDYKKLEKKSTEVKGFLNREEAIRIFEKSVVDYKEKFAVKA